MMVLISKNGNHVFRKPPKLKKGRSNDDFHIINATTAYLTNLPQKSMRAAMETMFQLELPPYSMMSRAVAT